MMETESDQTIDAGNPRRRGREQSGNDEPAGWPGGRRGPRAPGGTRADPRRGGRGAAGLLDSRGGAGLLDTGQIGQERGEGYRGRHSQPTAPAGGQRPAGEPWPPSGPARDDRGRGDGARGTGAWDDGTRDGAWDEGARDDGTRDDGTRRDAWSAGAGSYRREDAPVARRTPTGWRVGDEEVSDLTSAMVLADLLAAELPAEAPSASGHPAAPGRRDEQPDARQLQETVAQLEHALTVRVRVEQAIGVLAERHRLRPRQAFELLRSAARSRGRRVLEVAGEVVDSASNPLLRLPEELAKPPAVRRGRRMPRRPHPDE
jgi:hypothetical protein